MSITKLMVGAIVAGCLFAAGCVVRAPAPEGEVGVGVDQPAPQAEVMVAAPGPEVDFLDSRMVGMGRRPLGLARRLLGTQAARGRSMGSTSLGSAARTAVGFTAAVTGAERPGEPASDSLTRSLGDSA